MSLIMKLVRVVVVAGGGGGVLLAAPPLGVSTVGEELDAAPEETELVRMGRLLLLVQRATASGLMPKLSDAGLPSLR